MMHRPILMRPLAAGGLVAVPAGLVLLGMAVAGRLDLSAAILGIAIVAVAEMALLWRPVSDIAAVAAMIRGFQRGEAGMPDLYTRAADGLATDLFHLRREWLARNEELERLAQSYETTFEALPDPMFLLDGRGRIVRANAAARELFEREPVGSDLGTLARSPALLEAAARALSGMPPQDVEFSLPFPEERVFRARLRPLRDGGLDGAAVVAALHDTTAAKQAERQRADFVANASHELRTPLASLLGYVETLQGPARDDPEARERFLPIMHQVASRMARLVEDLLSLSRIEFDEHIRPTGAVDLAAVLRSVADGFAPQADERRISLELDIAPDLPRVPGQADQLAQVFQNLIDNALKYGRAGTSVRIAAARALKPGGPAARIRGPAAVVSVRDHGEGIAREHLPRLTERFFRCDAARSRELGGTGLGLAIVKHIVNRHRGALTVDSVLGEGSVFTVHLPAAIEEQAA